MLNQNRESRMSNKIIITMLILKILISLINRGSFQSKINQNIYKKGKVIMIMIILLSLLVQNKRITNLSWVLSRCKLIKKIMLKWFKNNPKFLIDIQHINKMKVMNMQMSNLMIIKIIIPGLVSRVSLMI